MHLQAQAKAKQDLASLVQMGGVSREVARLVEDPLVMAELKTLEKDIARQDGLRLKDSTNSNNNNIMGDGGGNDGGGGGRSNGGSSGPDEATHLEISAAFDALDLDGSGEIDLVEFGFMLRGLEKTAPHLLLHLGCPLSSTDGGGGGGGGRGGDSRASMSSQRRRSSVMPGAGSAGGGVGNNAKERLAEAKEKASLWRNRAFATMDRDNRCGVCVWEG
jgi:hypothetical protein